MFMAYPVPAVSVISLFEIVLLLVLLISIALLVVVMTPPPSSLLPVIMLPLVLFSTLIPEVPLSCMVLPEIVLLLPPTEIAAPAELVIELPVTVKLMLPESMPMESPELLVASKVLPDIVM